MLRGPIDAVVIEMVTDVNKVEQPCKVTHRRWQRWEAGYPLDIPEGAEGTINVGTHNRVFL